MSENVDTKSWILVILVLILIFSCGFVTGGIITSSQQHQNLYRCTITILFEAQADGLSKDFICGETEYGFLNSQINDTITSFMDSIDIYVYVIAYCAENGLIFVKILNVTIIWVPISYI